MGGGCGRSGNPPSCAPAGAAQAAAMTHAAIGSLTAGDDKPVPQTPNSTDYHIRPLSATSPSGGSADRVARPVSVGSPES
jgi:hypothetical protein